MVPLQLGNGSLSIVTSGVTALLDKLSTGDCLSHEFTPTPLAAHMPAPRPLNSQIAKAAKE